MTKRICVIGAGISGISCARILMDRGCEVEVFEKANNIGGLISCKIDNGNLFHKVGGHVFNTKNPKVEDWFWNFFSKDEEFIKAKRNATIFIEKSFIPYPIELNISSLNDTQIIKKIFYELEEISNVKVLKKNLNFDQFLKNNFGETLYEIYFKPYNSKIWKRSLKEIPLDWLEGKLPMINPKEILIKNISKVKTDGMPHEFFYYPKEGGSQFIIDRISEGININFSEILSIKNNNTIFDGNSIREYDQIIYTGSIKNIENLLEKDLSDNLDIKNELIDVKRLYSNGTFNVLCECDNNNFSWIYIPEKKYLAHRIIMTGNFAGNNNRKDMQPNRKSCVVEFSGNYKYEDIKKEIYKLPFNLTPINFNYTSESYVINDFNSKKTIEFIREKLESKDIYLCGRFAEWKYYNMDNCIAASIDLCDKITN